MAKLIVRQLHRQSWHRFISSIEHNVHGWQVIAYKVVKTLKSRKREAVSFTPIGMDTWNAVSYTHLDVYKRQHQDYIPYLYDVIDIVLYCVCVFIYIFIYKTVLSR